MKVKILTDWNKKEITFLPKFYVQGVSFQIEFHLKWEEVLQPNKWKLILSEAVSFHSHPSQVVSLVTINGLTMSGVELKSALV